MAKSYRGGATIKNSNWKVSGGSGGRKGSKLRANNDWEVAPLKASSGKGSGRKIRG